MSADETPQPIITRHCPQCGTLMTPARSNPRTGMAERFRVPGRLGGEMIRLVCENGRSRSSEWAMCTGCHRRHRVIWTITAVAKLRRAGSIRDVDNETGN